MTRRWRCTWVGGFAVLALVSACLAPAWAASIGPVRKVNSADLRLPAVDTPPGFTPRPERDQVVTTGLLGSLFGSHLQGTLAHDGFRVGYHGWLDGANTADLPFVTYDIYAFGSIEGAQAAQTTLSRLVQGLQTTSQDSRLPKNTATWTDGTETFGPTNQPFAVSEVVFRRANLLVTVIAYNEGGTANAISEALGNATTVAVACETFLKSRVAASSRPPGASSAVLP